MEDIMQKMIDCDAMVLASPVYFYSIDARLKAVIDRSVCRWTEVRNTQMYYYIMTTADPETGVYHIGEIKAACSSVGTLYSSYIYTYNP